MQLLLLLTDGLSMEGQLLVVSQIPVWFLSQLIDMVSKLGILLLYITVLLSKMEYILLYELHVRH